MRGWLFALLLALAPSLACAGGGPRLLVTLKTDATDALRGDPTAYAHRPHGYGASAHLAPTLDALARDFGLARVSGWPMRALGVHCEVFEARADADVDSIAARLMADPRVESAQPMHVYRTLTSADDPYRSLQRGYDQLALDAAHARSRGRGVRVAVIDSGVDAAHPDLGGAVRTHRDFAPGAAAPHGTEVAGVIAAREHNGVGIVGVAPEAEIVDLRACAAECDSYALAQALDFAITERAGVINLSLAGPDDPLLARLLAVAEARGIPVVAAAAPAGSADRFPASVPTVIGVAMSEEGAGAGIVSAPGRDVFTTVPGNRYDYLSGSSIASAHVAGILALARAIDPKASPAKLREVLRSKTELNADAVLAALAH